MSGTKLPALGGAAPLRKALPPSSASAACTPVLPHVHGSLPQQPASVGGAAPGAHEGGAMLRNLLGLSEAEEKEIAEREQKMQEKEALIAAAHAKEQERLQASAAVDTKAQERARLSKREAMLQQIQIKTLMAEEEKKLEDRSPDKGPSEEIRYGYVSPGGSPREARAPSPGDPSQQYGYSSPLDSPVSPAAGAREDKVAEGHGSEPELDYAQLAAGMNGAAKGVGGTGGPKLARKITLQAAGKRVVQSVKTPGFIMLDRLNKQSGKGLKNKQRDLWRLIKKHYAQIKKQRQAEIKASGKLSLLKGDLKKRALLIEKLKSAVLAVLAAREEQGPQIFGSLSKALDAERILRASPEYKAVQCLQRSARRAQPLTFHPGIGPARPVAHTLHVVWGAHVVLCRVAKARSSSDIAFLERFLVREQTRLLAAANPAGAAAKLRRLYSEGARRAAFDAARVLDGSVKRSVRNRQWWQRLWAGQEVSRWVRGIFPRRAYHEFPAISETVKAFFPGAYVTTALANHATALAQETLSAGGFLLAKALLKVCQKSHTAPAKAPHMTPKRDVLTLARR